MAKQFSFYGNSSWKYLPKKILTRLVVKNLTKIRVVQCVEVISSFQVLCRDPMSLLRDQGQLNTLISVELYYNSM